MTRACASAFAPFFSSIKVPLRGSSASRAVSQGASHPIGRDRRDVDRAARDLAEGAHAKPQLILGPHFPLHRQQPRKICCTPASPDFCRRMASGLPSWCGIKTTSDRDMELPFSIRNKTQTGGLVSLCHFGFVVCGVA